MMIYRAAGEDRQRGTSRQGTSRSSRGSGTPSYAFGDDVALDLVGTTGDAVTPGLRGRGPSTRTSPTRLPLLLEAQVVEDGYVI